MEDISGMFGVIVSGRPVQTDFLVRSPTQYVKSIPNADSVIHVAVFLTGEQPFPSGTAGLVYFCFPDGNVQLLGHLSNETPSAVFRVSNYKTRAQMCSDFTFRQQQVPNVAQIGISIEPILDVSNQSSMVVNDTESVKVFGQKMLENFMNYISSYTVPKAQMKPNPTETYAPLSMIKSWYSNFQRRLQQNPNFWRL